MAIENFKAVVLEEALIQAYKEASIVDVICQAPILVQGKTARFNVLGMGAIKDYTGTVEADEVVTTVIDLNYDKKKYYAVSVDDADACLLRADVLMPMAENLAHQLKKVMERDVLAEAVAKGKAFVPAGAGGFFENIVDAAVLLDEKNVPAENRFVIASPKNVAKLVKDNQVMAYNSLNVLENGVVEGIDINGMRVIKCNNLPAGKTVIMHKDAVGFGCMLENTEAIRSEHAFADVIRGLAVYGCVALRPDAIVTIDDQYN